MDGRSDFDEEDSSFSDLESYFVSKFTVDEVMDRVGHGKFHNILLLICGLVFASNAIQILEIAIITPSLQCEWLLSDFDVARISTATTLGMVVGSPFCGYFSDMYGRKRVLVLTSCLTSFFSLLIAFTPGLFWMILLRFVIGLALSSSTQVFTFGFESLPTKTKSRTLLIPFISSANAIVCSFVALIAMTLLSWRWFIVIAFLPAILVTLLFSLLPESPRYWTTANEPSNLMQTLARVAKVNKTSLPEGHLAVSKTTNMDRGRMWELLNSRMRLRTMILIAIHFSVGLLYYGIIFASVEDLEGLLLHEHGPISEAANSVTCKPCHYVGIERLSTLLSTYLAELFAAPAVFIILRRHRAKGALRGIIALSCIFYITLFIPGYAFAVRMSVVRFLLYCSVITAVVASPMYFPTRIRGFAIGMCNVAFQCGALTAPFLGQTLVKTSPRLVITIFLLVAAVAGLVSSWLNAGLENSSNKE